MSHQITDMRLFYVDDEEDVRAVVDLSIQLDPTIQFRAFSSGAAALQALDEGDWVPNCFLLDIMMPEMDGGSTLDEIRRRPGYESTPAAFISATRGPAIDASDKHIIAVLEKPFDPMTLAVRLRHVFEPHLPS